MEPRLKSCVERQLKCALSECGVSARDGRMMTTTTSDWLNVTDVVDERTARILSFEERTARILSFEAVIRVVVPVVFSVIAVLGFVGNLSVIIVVVANLQMRSTTNTLIISLAVADLLFIVICVPFTAVSYAITVWPFGTAWCMVSKPPLTLSAHFTCTTCLKNVPSLTCYNLDVHDPIAIIFWRRCY